MIREGFYEKVTFKERSKRGESISYADVLERKFQVETTVNPKVYFVRPQNFKENILDG